MDPYICVPVVLIPQSKSVSLHLAVPLKNVYAVGCCGCVRDEILEIII